MPNPQKENGYTPIANEIMEALAKIRINGEARQMLDVILRKTYGWNKKQDRISTMQFVEATGLPNYAIHKARHKLLKMGIIEVLPKKIIGITQKGNSQILTYSFQKDYTKWQPLPKKVTVTQKGNGYHPKRLQVSPKKVTNCNPKSDTQKKERHYTKDILTKERDFPFLKDPAFISAFNDYLAMRQKIRKSPTNRAQELVLIELHKHDIKTAIAMLEQSIINSWQGIFPLKKGDKDGFIQKDDDRESRRRELDALGRQV